MMNVRNVLIGFALVALAAGIIVACGGSSSPSDSGSGGGSGSGTPTFNVSGTLSGSTVPTVLKLNGGSDKAMATNGAFSFTGLAQNSTFNVQIVDGTDRCTVSTNGAGTVTTADVTGVTVTCAAQTTQVVVRSSTSLSGAQESPAVPSAGSGTGGIIFDPSTNAITGGITIFGITATSAGVYQAPSGNPTGNGASIITLGSAGDGHTYFIPVGTTLTAGQATSLLAGELYFNVPTAAYPDTGGTGEIRGQINLQGGALAAVQGMDWGQEVTPPGTCQNKTTTGLGMVIVDAATRAILISYMTHDVTTANLSHIHTSTTVATSNGPVIINFTPGPTLAYPTAAPSVMSAQNILDFQASYLYFNIHSTPDGCPGGEIRGNIAPTS
jgi:hypothetical protein